MQAPNYKWYLHKGYHKRSYSFEIGKLKGLHTCVSTFVQKNHHQLDANYIASAISTFVMNNLSMTVVSIHDEIKLSDMTVQAIRITLHLLLGCKYCDVIFAIIYIYIVFLKL